MRGAGRWLKTRLLLTDDLADRGFFSLQQRRGRGHFDGFSCRAGFELDVDHEALSDFHRQVLLIGFGETLGGGGHRVMADSDRREEILAAGAAFGFQGYVLVGIQQNHTRAGYDRACGVLHRSRNCSFIHLAECVPAWEQKEAHTCEGQEAKLPDPSERIAYKAHPNILHIGALVRYWCPASSTISVIANGFCSRRPCADLAETRSRGISVVNAYQNIAGTIVQVRIFVNQKLQITPIPSDYSAPASRTRGGSQRFRMDASYTINALKQFKGPDSGLEFDKR